MLRNSLPYKIDEMQSSRGPRNALHGAAQFGRPQQVADLLDGPNAIDIDGRTPHGLTPVMLAVEEGRSDNVRILLEKGASTSITDPEGFTALQIASEQGHFRVVFDLQSWGRV